MRIDGTDASGIQPVKAQDQSAKFVKTDTKDSLPQSLDIAVGGKNLSQLTDLEKRELPISDKIVIDAIEKANKAISGANRRFEFSIHEKTKEIMVKVIDSDTNEVIREIPPEKILDMVAKMWEMAGLIVDERR